MPPPRLIFCPGPALSRRWLSALHWALRQEAEVLFLPAEAGDLELGAIPGSHTLLAPRFPELVDEALRRCDGVITGNATLFDKARAIGVPVHRLSETDGKQSPTRLAARLAAALATRAPATQPLAASQPTPVEERATALELCSVADHRYLPFLIGFIENLRRIDFPLDHFHLLTLDDRMDDAVRDRYPRLPRLRPRDLWSAAEWEAVAARGRGARAFASKPCLLRQVLSDRSRPVLYTDLDIFYFASPERLATALGEAPALLFPQWNDQLWHSKFYGVFNAGMLVVQPGAEAFLHWWSEHCLHHYNGNFLQGYYADQGFLDLVPVHFPAVRIYRDGDHNLAYWNTGTLVESFDPRRDPLPVLRNGRALQSFHAAVPDRLGLYEWKFGWDQVVAFFAGLPPESRELLEEAACQQQSEHWLAVSRLRKLEQVLGRKLRLWHPAVARLLLHSPLQGLLRAAARIHYRLAAWRRALAGDSDHATTNRSHLRLLRPSDDSSLL